MTHSKQKRKRAKELRVKHAAKAEEEFKKAPHSFVIKRGKVGKLIRGLTLDMRRVMEPYTASQLQVRKKNVLKDFVSVSGLLNVSHLVVFTKSQVSVNLHIGKVPRGPTIVFRVMDYSLMQDILSFAKRPNMYQSHFTSHPLLIINNFSSAELHMKLMASMFQNMFPSINVNKVKLSTIKRCVLLSYNSQDDTIDFRHYIIRVIPTGMSRAVKKLTRPKVPNLGKYREISDYMDQGANTSGSEAEDEGDQNKVTLPQRMKSKGSIRGSKSSIQLVEIGPRMTLKLHKIEEGLWSGGVLYNAVVKKSPKEIKEIERLRELREKLKEQRRRQQMKNIKQKSRLKQIHKEKSLRGLKTRKTSDESTISVKMDVSRNDDDDDDDDDAEYYKQEVGHQPEIDLNLKRKHQSNGRASKNIHSKITHKRLKQSTVPYNKQTRRKNLVPNNKKRK